MELSNFRMYADIVAPPTMADSLSFLGEFLLVIVIIVIGAYFVISFINKRNNNKTDKLDK